MPRLNKKLRLQSSINSLEYPRVHEYLHEVAGEERGMRARFLMSLGMAVLDNQLAFVAKPVSSPAPATPVSPSPHSSADLSKLLQNMGVTGSLQFDTASPDR